MILNNNGAPNPFEGVKTVAVFGGTSEGRILAQEVQSFDFEVTVFVATEYGASMLEGFDEINLAVGRKQESEIADIIESNDMIIDATHPFATTVSETLKKLTTLKEKHYLRITRENAEVEVYENHIKVNSFDEAADFLKRSEGNILLATGSKNLDTFTQIPDFRNRLFVRVLPEITSISKCHELGIKSSHVMALQGPFDVGLNEALLKQCDARFFVTKDSGSVGGFLEKVIAAKNLGITLITVQRPDELDEALTINDVLELLEASNSSDIKVSQNVVENHVESPKPRNPISDENTFFPLFFDVCGKECLVVGAGKVGLRRATILADFGAIVTLVDPIFEKSSLSTSVQTKGYVPEVRSDVTIIGRSFECNDVKNKFLVVAATNSRRVNAEVFTSAKSEGCLINIADSPKDCDFYFPALVKGKDLFAGIISTQRNHSFLRKSAVQLRTYIISLEEKFNNEKR